MRHHVRLCDGDELEVIERGRGPPVMLLHGGMGDCNVWGSQIDALSPAYRVIAYSRRGHGSSTGWRAAQHSLDKDVDDLARLGQVLGSSTMHLVGTSYGALVALAYAVRSPSTVRSLSLAEPPLHRWARRTPEGCALFDAFMNDVWGQARRAFSCGDHERALQILIDGMWGHAVFASLPPARRAMALGHATSMQTLTVSPDPFPDLARSAVAALAMPVLLISGEHASPLHRCVIDELASTIAGARRCVIAGAGHGSPFEKPAQFNRAVLRFLALA